MIVSSIVYDFPCQVLITFQMLTVVHESIDKNRVSTIQIFRSFPSSSGTLSSGYLINKVEIIHSLLHHTFRVLRQPLCKHFYVGVHQCLVLILNCITNNNRPHCKQLVSSISVPNARLVNINLVCRTSYHQHCIHVHVINPFRDNPPNFFRGTESSPV